MTVFNDSERGFERRLNVWIQHLEATTRSSDPLWQEASILKDYIQNRGPRNPRMDRLNKHLDSALNILLVQSVQREKFLKEIRASKQ